MNDTRKHPTILSQKTIIDWIVNKTNPGDIHAIIKNETLLRKILKNFIEFTTNSAPNEMTIDQLQRNIDTNIPVKLDKKTFEIVSMLLSNLETFRAINKKHLRIKTAFNDQLFTSIETKQDDIWQKSNEWINNAYDPYIDFKNISYEPLQKQMNKWLLKCKDELKSILESSLKDYYHSQVNKHIILGKIKGDSGWKKTLINTNENKNIPLKQCETEIKKEIEILLAPINAPFVETFSKELFSRCYKHLITSEKINHQGHNIQTKINDISKHSLSQIKIEATLKSHFSDDYLALLEYVINNQTDIKTFVKTNSDVLDNVSRDKSISSKQQKDVYDSYGKLYYNIRKYEKEQAYWKSKITDVGNKSPNEQLWIGLQCIEAIFHRYKPFLVLYLNQLKNELTHNDLNKRKKSIERHKESIQKFQKVTEVLEIIGLINQQCKSPNHFNASELQIDHSELLNNALKPWESFDWLRILSDICENLNINKAFRTSLDRHMNANTFKKESNISSVLHNNPSQFQKTKATNNYIDAIPRIDKENKLNEKA